MREFIEQLPGLSFGRINKDSCRISGVSILRETSKNNSLGGKGRRYSEAAMESVARLVNNVKAYADHAGNRQLEATRGVRSVRDLIGYFTGGRVDGSKVTADLNYLESAKDWIEPLVEKMADKVGMSVWAFGPSRLDRQTREELVEDISTLKSVDLVSEPGSTTGLFESSLFTKEDLKQCESDLQEIEFLEAFGIRPDRRDRDEDDPDERFRREYGIHPDRKDKKLNRHESDLKAAIRGHDLFS
jgi:hypothetical protein